MVKCNGCVSQWQAEAVEGAKHNCICVSAGLLQPLSNIDKPFTSKSRKTGLPSGGEVKTENTPMTTEKVLCGIHRHLITNYRQIYMVNTSPSQHIQVRIRTLFILPSQPAFAHTLGSLQGEGLSSSDFHVVFSYMLWLYVDAMADFCIKQICCQNSKYFLSQSHASVEEVVCFHEHYHCLLQILLL